MEASVANKLRVFISSTMKNLPNERYEVVRQLTALGFEPVNAEDFAPLGENSWDTIKPKIEDSHIFVLILGESYGWVPDKGYGAGHGDTVCRRQVAGVLKADNHSSPCCTQRRVSAKDSS
jgi:hypothetical protein